MGICAMSIASKISLAAAFAAGLAVTGAQAAVQEFSIALTNIRRSPSRRVSAQGV
jgi:hypothetical protein